MNSVYFALLAAIFWGVAPIFGKLGVRSLDPLAALAIRSGIVTATLAVTVIFLGKCSSVWQASPREVGFISLEGLFAALLGQLAYYYALKYGEASQVVPVVAAFPLVALVVGLVVLQEKIMWWQTAGAVLITVGIALINYR